MTTRTMIHKVHWTWWYRAVWAVGTRIGYKARNARKKLSLGSRNRIGYKTRNAHKKLSLGSRNRIGQKN